MIDARAKGIIFVMALVMAVCDLPSVIHAQGTKRDSAGVEIIQVPRADRRIGWTFQKIMSVGGADDDRLTLPELDARYVVANAAGRIFVLDWLEGVVQVIEPDGRPGKSLGRKGRGPGELTVARGLDVAADGSVLVVDAAKRAFVRWDATGKVMSEKPFAVSIFGGQVRSTNVGVIMQIRDLRSRQTRMRLAHVMGDSAVDLAALTWPPTRAPTYVSCPEYSVESPPFFWPWLKWDYNDGYVAVVSSARYEIDVFQGDRLVRSIRRDIEPMEVTDAVIAEEIESITVRGCTIPGAERAKVLGYMRILPVIAAVAVGPGGRIWVQRHVPGPETDKIDVFTVDGDYEGTILAGEPFPASFVGKDGIVELTQDSQGVPVIRRYKWTIAK